MTSYTGAKKQRMIDAKTRSLSLHNDLNAIKVDKVASVQIEPEMPLTGYNY